MRLVIQIILIHNGANNLRLAVVCPIHSFMESTESQSPIIGSLTIALVLAVLVVVLQIVLLDTAIGQSGSTPCGGSG
ncbi:hypothetical protein ElyMa_000405400 [Elysia marginata]|uniref:Uncharacterized protein n=1 Tax=Elysia marginata TaxID=1093978 RepID=A0AAV4FKH0_9GAST|nr:hypothetical protein ElyMa_000405400 [Elysia marginata]